MTSLFYDYRAGHKIEVKKKKKLLMIGTVCVTPLQSGISHFGVAFRSPIADASFF